MKKENWSGFENLLNQTLDKVIEIEGNNPMSYACLDCKYMWLETTHKSQEYIQGFSCPKCGSENISGKKN